MRIMPVWSGAVIGVGPDITIRVSIDSSGNAKLAITAPPELRIVRGHGTPPKHNTPLAWSRSSASEHKR